MNWPSLTAKRVFRLFDFVASLFVCFHFRIGRFLNVYFVYGCGVFIVYAFSLSFNLFFRLILLSGIVASHSISISFTHLSRVDHSMLFLRCLCFSAAAAAALCFVLSFQFTLDSTQLFLVQRWYCGRPSMQSLMLVDHFICRCPWSFRQFNECFLINVNALRIHCNHSNGYRKMMRLSQKNTILIRIKEDLHPLHLLPLYSGFWFCFFFCFIVF